MIRPLRKAHYYVWRIAGLALPILFLSALLLRPEGKIPESSQNDFDFSWDQTDTEKIVTINVLNPIGHASCLVYAVVAEKEILVGKLSDIKEYQFEIPNETEAIILRDILNREIMRELTDKRNSK